MIELFMMLALGNPAECVDWAAFSYYAAVARDEGMSQQTYTARIKELVSREEFYDQAKELPFALALVDSTFKSKLSPEVTYQLTLEACQNRKTA